MPYNETIEEDLQRAKEILEKGKADEARCLGCGKPVSAECGCPAGTVGGNGGTIYGVDLYAAYKLLESFVAEIERQQKASTVTDRPGRPVAAPCTLEGCQYERVEEHEEAFSLFDKASTALMDAYKQTHPEVPANVWPGTTEVNVWAAAEILTYPIKEQVVQERVLKIEQRQDALEARVKVCLEALTQIVNDEGAWHDGNGWRDGGPALDKVQSIAKTALDVLNTIP